MINLLPPEEKFQLLFLRKKKTAAIIWIFVIVFLLSLSFALYSVNSYLKIKISTYNFLLQEEEGASLQAELKTMDQKISEANNLLKQVMDFYQKKPYLSDILAQVSSSIPEDTFLTSLSISYAPDDGLFDVSLAGFSPDRDHLFLLKKNLEKNSRFQEIYFPPSNWVKAKDINFLVTFQIQAGPAPEKRSLSHYFIFHKNTAKQ